MQDTNIIELDDFKSTKMKVNITSKNELKFFIMSDLMMNRGYFKVPFKKRLLQLVSPDYIMEFLKTMSKVQYYSYSRKELCWWGGILLIINKLKFFRLSRRLGFSIGYDVFDYGLVIPHYGTIVVGNTNRVGPYAVMHTSTCITDTGRKIGKALSLSTGAKITGGEVLGDNVVVAANSVVTKSFEGNALLVGMPAGKKSDLTDWYSSLKGESKRRVDAVENLKIEIGIG